MVFRYAFAIALISALLTAVLAAPPCTSARPIAICLEYLNPFSANAYEWTEAIGTPPSDPSVLCGENGEFWDSVDGCSTPATWTATCCAEGKYGVYIDCDGPETALPPIWTYEDLAVGWEVDIECAVDVPSRVLANVVTSTDPSHATPYTCMEYCQTLRLDYAGVEYGTECHCGTGYAGGVAPTVANVSDCDMRCAGDYQTACGGSWRIQLYNFFD